uniref:Integrase catalytic domain-containing protein n=1 Tax=Tanacetum cinerariifolium TaxID=118510 RepID=A0A699HKH3_TANCI|nr:hypothetical protein [Tanacetum cinerariifolium]
MKFLRSLPAEWNTHVVFWRNKADLDTMSIDDLYNNFKIVKQEVKRTVVSSSSSGSPNMAFLSSPGSNNEADTASIQVSAASIPVSTISSLDNTDNLSDANVYDFLENQLISFAESERKKVLPENRECKSYRNYESRPRNQDSSRKTVIVEDISSKAMVAIDEEGFDWSYMADDEVPTNMALMAFSDSEVHNSKTCSNTCLKSFETLKTQYHNLRIEFNKSEFDLATYKRGLGFTSYNVVAPLPTSLFVPPTIDLSNSSPEEFKQHEFEGYGPKASKSVSVNTSNEIKKAPDAPIIKDWVDEEESEEMILNSKNVQHKPKQANQPRNGNKVTSVVGNKGINDVKSSVCWVKRPKIKVQDHVSKNSGSCICKRFDYGAPQDALKDQGYFDSGCSRYMTGNISYLTDFKEHDGGYVAFGGRAKGGKITGKGTIRTADESQILLKVPRKNNMYSFDMNNIVPQKDLTCLLTKATNDESMLWHKRLGHINFKNINKLVKDNLMRRLPLKRFDNDQTCVACLKGKQHKVSFKSKLHNSISQPLFMLHMDLFGSTSMSSIMHEKYCHVITDDFSRFTWVFFLATKDETSRILKTFITKIENLVEKKVKIIRCDNETELKNRNMNEFCEEKSIKREYSVARTPQQNKVAEIRNRTLIEATRTMLADSKLPTTFWAEAVNTACYVQNRVLVVKPYFKTPYELFKDNGIFVGYSTTSKAFRVYNIRTRKVEKNLHITFLENKPMIAGGGPVWLFDLDALSKSMNYVPVSADSHNKDKHGPSQASESYNQERPNADNSTKTVNTNRPVNTTTPTYAEYPNDLLMYDLEDVGIFDDAYDDRDEGTAADYNNLETIILVSPIPSTRIHKDHPKEHIIRETLVDLPYGKKASGTKWLYRNKRDQRGIVVKNKARLVAHGHRQKEGIDYDEFFASVARIKAIRLFLAYASFMDFTVYQIDVKSAFLYGTIAEEIYVSQPPGFVDPEFPDKVVKSASTPMETHKPLSKDAAGTYVDVYLYRYLKGQPTLGLWYSKDSPLELIAYSNSDYAGASLDRKSTIGGCQFLGLELKGYLINDGYADLVQHAGVYFNTAGVFLLGFHQHNK